jgi:hypothetical protein
MRPLDQPLRLRIRGSADDHLRAEGCRGRPERRGSTRCATGPPRSRRPTPSPAAPHQASPGVATTRRTGPRPAATESARPTANASSRTPSSVPATGPQYGTGPGASVGRSLRDGGRSCCGASAGPCRDAPAVATGAASSPPPRHVRAATVLRWCSDVRHVTGTTGTEPARGHRYARPPSPNSSRCHRRTPVDQPEHKDASGYQQTRSSTHELPCYAL